MRWIVHCSDCSIWLPNTHDSAINFSYLSKNIYLIIYILVYFIGKSGEIKRVSNAFVLSSCQLVWATKQMAGWALLVGNVTLKDESLGDFFIFLSLPMKANKKYIVIRNIFLKRHLKLIWYSRSTDWGIHAYTFDISSARVKPHHHILMSQLFLISVKKHLLSKLFQYRFLFLATVLI